MLIMRKKSLNIVFDQFFHFECFTLLVIAEFDMLDGSQLCPMRIFMLKIPQNLDVSPLVRFRLLDRTTFLIENISAGLEN